MPGLLGIINLGLSALTAHRNALHVRSHNLANVHTPGYSRQDVVLGTTPPSPPAGTSEAIVGGQYGTGVSVLGVRRAYESFLGIQLRICSGSLGRFSAAASALRETESVIAPGPGGDIGAALDRFWAAWEQVANDPSDLGLRHVLREAGASLASQFRQQVERLNSIRLTLDDGLQTRVAEVNALTAQIAELNRQISVALAERRTPNDLLDSRDVLLERLATLTGATPATSQAGHINVYLDGRPIVQGATSYPLAVTGGPGGVEIRSGYDGAPLRIARGEIGGLLFARDSAIPGYLSALDALAGTLASEVNARHRTGYGLDGGTERDFFAAGSVAGDIALDPAEVQDPRAIAAGAAPAPGDGSVALDIAALRTTAVLAARTLNEHAHSLLGIVGADLAACMEGEEAQRYAIEQIRAQQQSISGVAIDEELTYLMLAQRAYEAAARIISAADDMIRTVLELRR